MRVLKLLFLSREFVTSAAVSAGILLALAAAVGAIRYDIGRRADAIQAARRDIAIRARSLEAFSFLKNQSVEAQQYTVTLRRKLPQKDDLITFPKTVERLAAARRVKGSFAFNAETPPTDGAPGLIAFTLVVTGEYGDIASFLTDLEKAPAIVVTDTLDLLRSEEGFRGTIQGRVFYQ
ncbi:MAG: type 4a pilus biogenesis protein PilO [Candidatus Liptonbacteria bacterium]|nr:type 4a pilus biogenesis protein PilO [Candidatus Liptonbacteria bacterium]